MTIGRLGAAAIAGVAALAAPWQAFAAPPSPEPAAMVTVDDAAALRVFRKHADEGDPAAANRLGEMYQQGQGAPQDFAEAANWFTKAAEAGNGRAQLALALMYARGQGVPQDNRLGLLWLEKGETQFPETQREGLRTLYVLNLGSFSNGSPLSGKQPAVRARPAFLTVAEAGNVATQVAVARMYAEGRGAPRDFAKAAIWYRRAALRGDAAAETALGELLAAGKGVDRDPAEAFAWFLKAARQNNAPAELAVARAYESGFGVARDPIAAAAVEAFRTRC